MRGAIRVLALLLCAWSLLAFAATPSAADSLALTPAFGGLRFEKPVALVSSPRPRMWYVAEQSGIVMLVEEGKGKALPSVMADLRDRVESGPNEAGLLGIALHPGFAENGKIYLSYTAPGAPLVSRISEFVSRDRGLTLDPASERIVLALDQPYGNHNGGHIAFGPDGFLYIGFGDGGSGGDPRGNGQNLDALLGKLLRIDVDGGTPYAIPPDNPFANGGGRAEIYASGLRNPWRFSFDRETGALWLADVGQEQWEEINLVVRGGNYGWNRREGAHCFETDACRTDGLIDPVAEYGHDEGCSVTGGYVYRGKAMKALTGVYFYTDYCSGTVWGLFPKSGGGHERPRVLLKTERRISSFGEGADGELYILDHGKGTIQKIVGK